MVWLFSPEKNTYEAQMLPVGLSFIVYNIYNLSLTAVVSESSSVQMNLHSCSAVVGPLKVLYT